MFKKLVVSYGLKFNAMLLVTLFFLMSCAQTPYRPYRPPVQKIAHPTVYDASQKPVVKAKWAPSSWGDYRYDKVPVKPRTKGATDVMQAVKNYDLVSAKKLLASSNVNAADNNGRTLLHYVSKYSNDGKFAGNIIAEGAVVNAKDHKGKTPLRYALDDDNNKVAAMLILKGSEKLALGERRAMVEYEMSVLKKEEARQTKLKQLAIVKRYAKKQKCKLKEKNWYYMGSQCNKGFAHGKGSAIHKEGSLKYKGMFSGGFFSRGQLVANRQVVYAGGFSAGSRHGVANCYEGNKKYSCQYSRGQLVRGRLKLGNNVLFEGKIKNNQANGKGICLYPDSEKESCQFNNGLMVKGRYFEHGQLVFEGRQYKNGKPHGAGVCFYENTPEKCEYYKGSRIDALYKQRLAMEKQNQEMAAMREEIQRLKSSQNSRSVRVRERPVSRGRTSGGNTAESNRLAECATLLLKKKACDHIGGFGGMACMALIPGGHNCF